MCEQTNLVHPLYLVYFYFETDQEQQLDLKLVFKNGPVCKQFLKTY